MAINHTQTGGADGGRTRIEAAMPAPTQAEEIIAEKTTIRRFRQLGGGVIGLGYDVDIGPGPEKLRIFLYPGAETDPSEASRPHE
jgi:hypothetical protein